jgi:hypothetical protein
MADWLMDGVVGWLAERVEGLLSGLVAFLSATVFTSPDVTVFPQVQLLAGRSAVVVSTGFGLAIIAAGAVAMTHGSVQAQYGVRELLPRLVFGFVISHFGAQLCQLLITTANALTHAMVAQSAPGPRAAEYVRARIAAISADPTAGVLAVVIGLLIVVLMYALLASWIVRIGVLIVLAAVAPVALACYCLPYTQPAAQLWWRTLLACLATPVLQAVSFTSGINLLLAPEGNLPVLIGLQPGAPSMDMFNLFVILCLVWLTVRIPRLMSRWVTHRGGQTSVAGIVLRAVVIQSVTRRLPIPRSR